MTIIGFARPLIAGTITGGRQIGRAEILCFQ